jgi:hypothetical protein
MSISRASGVGETSSAIEISSSVVLPRADSTATTRWPRPRAATMRRAARLIRSASATEVPPNFMTTVPDTEAQSRRPRVSAMTGFEPLNDWPLPIGSATPMIPVRTESDGGVRARMRRVWIGPAAMTAVLLLCPGVASAQRDRPEITAPPVLSGVAQVGQRLDATGATWRGREPMRVTWAWMRCPAADTFEDCEFVDDVRVPAYTLGDGDLGRHLRALVLVGNDDGYDYAWSEPSAAVAPVPPPPPPPPLPVVVQPSPVVVPPRTMRPAPVVRFRGWLTSRGARLTLLTVRAPRGARIAVRCRGAGCPRERVVRMAALKRLRTYEARLRAGVRLVVRVTKPGFIGKHTVIRIRRGKAPTRRDRCLYPGSRKPAACPR